MRNVGGAYSKPFCCPVNAECVPDGEGYKCQITRTRAQGADKSGSSNWWKWLLGALAIVVAALLICWGIYKLYIKNGGSHSYSSSRAADVRI